MSLSKSIAKNALIDISGDANNSLVLATDGMLLTGIIFPATMTGSNVTFDFALDKQHFRCCRNRWYRSYIHSISRKCNKS